MIELLITLAPYAAAIVAAFLMSLLVELRRTRIDRSSDKDDGHPDNPDAAPSDPTPTPLPPPEPPPIDETPPEKTEVKSTSGMSTEDQIRAILGGEDEAVARHMLRMINQEQLHPYLAVQRDVIITNLAKVLEEHELNVLSFAANMGGQLDHIELDSSGTEDQVPYPTNDERRKVAGFEDITSLAPEYLALDDGLVDRMITQGDVHIPHYFERQRTVRRLVVLIDISPSMDWAINDDSDEKRIQLAAGAALKLLLHAKAGQSEYILIFFDGGTSEARILRTKEDFDGMSADLVRLIASGNNTDIQNALDVGVGFAFHEGEQVDESRGRVRNRTFSIVLISDGESDLDRDWLEEVFLHGYARLHVHEIGNFNPLLRHVATSYYSY